MFRHFLVVLVIAAISGRTSSTDVYTSTAHLRNLLSNTTIADSIRRYIAQEERKIATLKLKLAVLDDMRMAKYGEIRYSEHPVGVYQIMRAYYDINETLHDTRPFDVPWVQPMSYQRCSGIYGKFHCNTAETVKNAINDLIRETSETIPDAYDLLGASLGIVRLHKTYKLSAYDLIQGRIGNVTTSQLGIQESFHIAKTAYDNKFYDEALSWMNAVYDTYKHSIGGYLRKSVLLHQAYCYEKIPDIHSLRKTLKILDDLYPNDAEIAVYITRVDQRLSHAVGAAVKTETADARRYETLCRGETSKRKQTFPDRQAVCRYRPVRAPYDRVKEEVLSLSPYVLFYYDVITPSENKMITEMAEPRLKTSKVGIELDKSHTTTIRVSKTAWFFDKDTKDERKLAARISRRIGLITGLSTMQRVPNSDCEALQVVNYGIGGQYEPHLDSAPGVNQSQENIAAPVRGSGDRIATFLVYLRDVRMGGATVFPRAGLKVDSVKNGAVFWYNIQPSGAYDWLTLHAGCPVLLGEKWIMNKWFREKGQMFRRPCGLRYNTPQEHLYLPHDHRFSAK